MDSGFEIIKDFAMNIDKLDLAILVRQVIKKIVEFHTFFTIRKLYQNVKQHVFFVFEKKLNLAMDIDKLNLANLMGKVMDQNMEYKTFLPKCKCRERQKLGICRKSRNFFCIKNHENSPKELYFK